MHKPFYFGGIGGFWFATVSLRINMFLSPYRFRKNGTCGIQSVMHVNLCKANYWNITQLILICKLQHCTNCVWCLSQLPHIIHIFGVFLSLQYFFVVWTVLLCLFLVIPAYMSVIGYKMHGLLAWACNFGLTQTILFHALLQFSKVQTVDTFSYCGIGIVS